MLVQISAVGCTSIPTEIGLLSELVFLYVSLPHESRLRCEYFLPCFYIGTFVGTRLAPYRRKLETLRPWFTCKLLSAQSVDLIVYDRASLFHFSNIPANRLSTLPAEIARLTRLTLL